MDGFGQRCTTARFQNKREATLRAVDTLDDFRRTEILESIFGVARGWRGGDIAVDGEPVSINSASDACRLGVAMVTEDRKALGLHIASTIRDNVALPSVGLESRFGIRGFAREAALATDVVERLGVRCSGINQIVGALSGGKPGVDNRNWEIGDPAIIRPVAIARYRARHGVGSDRRQRISLPRAIRHPSLRFG